MYIKQTKTPIQSQGRYLKELTVLQLGSSAQGLKGHDNGPLTPYVCVNPVLFSISSGYSRLQLGSKFPFSGVGMTNLFWVGFTNDPLSACSGAGQQGRPAQGGLLL